MPSYVQTAFTGGEISQASQGRMDLPAYKISMNSCLNGIPMESGNWQRRPGTQHVGPSRGGATGRVIKFAFEESFPYQMAFTDGFLRFTTGPAFVMTNDAQAVVSVSTANPAVVQTTTAHGWSTGNTVVFNSLGVNNPLLQNRQFVITVVDTTHFSIADAITGTAINGSTLGSFVSGNVTRILEIATTYSSGSWSNLRSVQAETRTLLLNGTLPQVLQVATLPTVIQFATFTFGPANFLDGPYLDPIPNSVVSSSALNGVVTLTFSFVAWISSQAYNVGDFVTFSGVCYQSLTALNQNLEPDTHSSNWAVVNGGAAVNNGQGFLSGDIGRLIRLYSEPALWAVGTAYVAGNIVAYPDGQGGFSYWTSTSSNTGVQPGTTTDWSLNATGSTWTWAQITAVSGAGLINPATAIGTLTGGGGLAAAFDGNTTKAFAAAANSTSNITTYPVWSATNWPSGSVCQYSGFGWEPALSIFASNPSPIWSAAGPNGTGWNTGSVVFYQNFLYQANQAIPVSATTPPNDTRWSLFGAVSTAPPAGGPGNIWNNIGAMSSPTLDIYVGQHYGSATSIQSATIYPPTDVGMANPPNGANPITLNLRASNSSPSSPSNGTLLATSSFSGSFQTITLTSSDQVSTWSYVWIEMSVNYLQPLPDNGSHVFVTKIGLSQVQFFSPNVSNGSVITAQIRGPALLYNQTIRTWQLGVYSNTTGWPTCGAYHEGRIWLGGVVSNRFDACVSNGFVGTEIDFTPTAPDGTVSDSNSISYICDGQNSNELLWMTADQQGVLFGTQEGPWLISAPSPGAMSPTNIQAVRVNGPGTANTEPRRAEHTLIYIHRFTRKIVEFFADVFSGKFSAPNLSERAKHLTVNGIAEIAYQQELAPVIWSRRNDGALIGATYKRDTLTTSQGPNIIGWHRHQLGSGRSLESISVGPSVGGNLENLSMVTNDLATGIRHIELMTDLLDEGFALTSCMFLDNAILPSSTVVNVPASSSAWSSLTTYSAGNFVTFSGTQYVSIANSNLNNLPNASNSAFWLVAPYGCLTVNGLWDHNGKLVSAFIAGLDCGDYTVVNGSIYVPFGDSISGGTGSGLFTATLVQSLSPLPAAVGFTYTSQGQLVRHIEQGQSGPTFAELGRTHRAGALLYGCVNGSISFGTDFVTMFPAKLLQPNGTPYTPQQLWSGIWRDNLNSIYDFDNMICWQITRPLPAFVMAVGGFGDKAGA